jgi:beta-galactosidase
MVELRDKRILIDGEPVLVFSGEIHYFRLPRDQWEDRIQKLKDLGANAVATYIPWLVHEPREGHIDLDGSLRPEHDLTAFIDLCHRNGLWFIARPGPFVMAELKNEGIPYWVYEKHPEAVPVSWDGERCRSRTLNYLSPGFLRAVERWYGAVMPLLAERLQPQGGPVIAVQLDNEVGMLQWVTNQPDFSEEAARDFHAWLMARYSTDGLARRYSVDPDDPAAFVQVLRVGLPEVGAALHLDYGDYTRGRFARYIATLRRFAEENGVTGVPFIVNIHGSGGGRGTHFPIGIHQLMEAYTQAAGYLSGSDHYFGELTRENAPDFYSMNAFMAAVHRPEQPLSSLEFEVGTGDYGETAAVRQSGASTDFKARLSIVQGNRLLNYYLLAGGVNPPLLDPVGDGNDRIAFTGERHGFAAPISPEGELDPTYWALRETTQTLRAVAPKLADMDEEHDPLALGFLPDYYKTDMHRPGPMETIVRDLGRTRGPLEILTRSLLFEGYRFPAFDLQNREPDPERTPVLMLAAAQHMDALVQQRLAEYVDRGGKLFLFGSFPALDMEGQPCPILANFLGLRPLDRREASEHCYLSIKGEGWAATEPEVRVEWAQTFDADGPEVFMKVRSTGEACGVERSVGRGQAVVLASTYPAHGRLFSAIFNRLGLSPGISHGWTGGGVLSSSVRNRLGERFLNLINLDAEEKPLTLSQDGEPLFGDEVIYLPGRSARLLPLNVQFGPLIIRYATTEIVEAGSGFVRFRATHREERVLLESERELVAQGAAVTQEGREYKLRLPPNQSISVRAT